MDILKSSPIYKELSEQQRKRVEQALRETKDALARAMRYSPQHRDQKLIAKYESHILKLESMLRGDV